MYLPSKTTIDRIECVRRALIIDVFNFLILFNLVGMHFIIYFLEMHFEVRWFPSQLLCPCSLYCLYIFKLQFCFIPISHLSTALQALTLYFRGGAHWTESIDQCYHIAELPAPSIDCVGAERAYSCSTPVTSHNPAISRLGIQGYLCIWTAPILSRGIA